LKYATASTFRAALEARLQARSRESGTSLVRLRKAVVFDRLLARLVVVAPGRWVLKGALALDYRLGDRTRTTKDLDLGRQDDEEAATADFLAAQAVEIGDHFVFVIQRTDRLDQLQEGVAVRYHAACELAGRPFDDITIDVAFGDAPISEPEVVLTSALLAFADIDPVEVPAIPLTQHVAEKVHAYSRAYGRRGIPSSRVKDLIDLVLIAKTSSLDATQLQQALSATFRNRGRQALPDSLPLAPQQWRAAYRRMADEVGIADVIEEGQAVAAALLDPVLKGHVTVGTWVPASRTWSTPDG
jgi:predicted nucleotidyltransferase component of viral defense system